MQQYNDHRFTATLCGPQPDDSIAAGFDSFTNALRFVRYAQESRGAHVGNGTICDNRANRIVLRINSRKSWACDQALAIIADCEPCQLDDYGQPTEI